MRSISAPPPRIAINGSAATVVAGATTGTSVVALSFAGLRGGSWSISANNYFSVDASGVVRTTSTPTVAGVTYRPTVTFSYAGGGTALTAVSELSIQAQLADITPTPPTGEDAKVVARAAPAVAPPNFSNLTTADTGIADTGSAAQFWEFQPQNVGFSAYFRVGETGSPLELGITNSTYVALFGVPGNQYTKIGLDIQVNDVSDPTNGKLRASMLPSGDFEVLQNGVRKALIGKATILAANPDAYNADRTGIRFRSNAEFDAVTGGAYTVLYKPVNFVSAGYDSLGFVEATVDYYMAEADYLTMEVLTGDGASTLIAKVNAAVVDYPQAGRVRLRSKTALPANKRGFPTRIRITQATSEEAATQSGVVWAAPPSFATNPNAATYFYLNAPTANKNVASWRNGIDAGDNVTPVLDATGTPIAAEFANGKRPLMYTGSPAKSSQRTRLQIIGKMTGLNTRNNGGGASITDIGTVSFANGESWVDFTWNWDQLSYYRRDWGSIDKFLMQIQPLGTTAYTNCRMFEINDDGSRRSPGHWDVDHIAINSRYSKFPFAMRFMDMMNTVGTAWTLGDPRHRSTRPRGAAAQHPHEGGQRRYRLWTARHPSNAPRPCR